MTFNLFDHFWIAYSANSPSFLQVSCQVENSHLAFCFPFDFGRFSIWFLLLFGCLFLPTSAVTASIGCDCELSFQAFEWCWLENWCALTIWPSAWVPLSSSWRSFGCCNRQHTFEFLPNCFWSRGCCSQKMAGSPEDEGWQSLITDCSSSLKIYWGLQAFALSSVSPSAFLPRHFGQKLLLI